ncbi:MAG: aspartyl protease family protein [Caulobacteraceae bacterium]
MTKSAFAALRLALGLAVAIGAAHARQALAKCEIVQVAELQVVMDHNRALVPVEINGHPVQMIVDTGAATSMLFESAVHDFKLPTHDLSGGGRYYGAGGEAAVRIADIAEMKLDARYAAKNIRILVAGGGQFGKSPVAGLLGQDILGHWDIDFDLAHNSMRFLQPTNCHGEDEVYWSATYSKVGMELDLSLHPHAAVRAVLNGKPVDAYLDTGAGASIVTLAAAADAGVRPNTPGVVQLGVTHGVGHYDVPIWTAVFDSFTIGDETIKRAKIQMGDMFQRATYEETGSSLAKHVEGLPSMLLGADFFLAHHILISNQQKVVYFTYNGGPVFDTSQPHRATPPTAPTAASTPQAPAVEPPHVTGTGGQGL